MIIESFMYFGIGFLLAALSVLGVAPLIHGRAVRLTVRRMDASIPQSMAEVQADKDLLRAEFATSTRRPSKEVTNVLFGVATRGAPIRFLAPSGTGEHHVQPSPENQIFTNFS